MSILFGILCQARESEDSCSNQKDLHGLLVYGSPTRLHKGYANKSRTASGKKAGPFGTPVEAGLHPGKKLVRSNPTESSRHGVISYSESGY